MTKYINRFNIVCALFCFTFNSTFPLHRDTSIGYTNYRTKKMASNFENTLRKIKDTTHDFGKNIYDHLNTGFKSFTNRNIINEDDIRQYEQLVIMKKYPYLDLHELEMKYFPVSSKNTRNSESLYLDRKMQREPSLSEPGEDLLNVEIVNRGLSGFAIPPHLSKHGMVESKSVIKPVEGSDNFLLTKKSSHSNVLRSLSKDIDAYVDKKNVPML